MKKLRHNDIPPVPFLWTRGIAARETLFYLDRHGVDAEPLLSQAELSRSQLTENTNGVSVASQHRFLELASIEAKDPALGLHVAAEVDLREIGLLFYLAASSATIAEALRYLAQYAATANEEIRLDIADRKDEAVVIFRPVLGLGEPRRQYSELIALALSRVLRRLTNRDFVPVCITFSHDQNRSVREAHRLLRCPVEFGQPVDSWVLPQSVMKYPILSEDSHLLQILEMHAEDLLAKRRSAAGLRGLVESQLLSVLPSGRMEAAEIAKQLGTSLRTLSRRLADEGTSFGEILDQLRNRLALRYLQDDRVSIQQTAWLLGYSEISAFNHAFKRWTGTSPGRVRKSARIRRPGQ